LFVKEPQIRKIEPADWRRLIEPFRPPECTETDSDGKAFDARTYPGCCAQLRKAAQDARQAVRQTQLPIFVINRFLKKYEMNPQATGVAGFHGIYINFSRLTSSIYDHDRVLNPRQALYATNLRLLFHEIAHFLTFRELDPILTAIALRRRVGDRLREVMNLLNFVFTAQFETPLLEDLNPEYLEQEEAFELLAEAGAVVLWLKLLSSAPGPLDTGSVTYLIDMAQTARSVPSLQKLFETAEWVLSLHSRPASVDILAAEADDVVLSCPKEPPLPSSVMLGL